MVLVVRGGVVGLAAAFEEVDLKELVQEVVETGLPKPVVAAMARGALRLK